MKRHYHGVRVLPLTESLAAQLSEQGKTALCGDGSCSLANMNESCFASERCARGGSGLMRIEELLAAPYAFVACTDSELDDPTVGVPEGLRFLGCVSARPADSMRSVFPDIQENALLLSNLCTSSTCRRHGIGRRLVDRIRATGRPVYLMIVKPTGPDADVARAFQTRVARLFETYGRMSFQKCGECDFAHLLRHA
jgi:ribosomal protein S18 acetylase RimI-like enzyme